MNKVWRIILTFIMFFIITVPVHANEWRGEFDRLCGYTQEAEKFTIDELKGFMSECDKLSETITASDSPNKKVFIFRLKKCRNFFEYMIGVKELEAEKAQE